MNVAAASSYVRVEHDVVYQRIAERAANKCHTLSITHMMRVSVKLELGFVATRVPIPLGASIASVRR